MNESAKTCCFTGHRTIPASHLSKLCTLLDSTITDLFEQNVRTFRAGGALGFDTIAALRVLSLKAHGLDIRLDLILPCRDQTRLWPRNAVLDYQFILENADHVTYISDSYNRYCMLERDRALVDGSDICISYLTKNQGGTAYTVAYALKKQLTLINLGNSFLQKLKQTD